MKLATSTFAQLCADKGVAVGEEAIFGTGANALESIELRIVGV